MEYFIQTDLGLVSITPCAGLPTAVELRIAGIIWAAYPSAEDAARAVSSSSTGHAPLDALWCALVPAFLSDWKQSVPHHFATGTLQPAEPEEPEQWQFTVHEPLPDEELAFATD